MALDQRKYERKHTDVLRDIRPMYVRLGDWLKQPGNSFAMYVIAIASLYIVDPMILYLDIMLILYTLFFIWLWTRDRSLAFKMPVGARWKDSNNQGPGRGGKPEGILYLGNVKDTNEEVWFSNSDCRTHILYLGTTGSGKTEGLKSLVTNAMTWGSGFVYVDGKADTDLWSSLSSLVRRFGRDDDLLVLNYMTGNSDAKAPSNTMNPFSSGSASYLTNMLVSLMPESEGDNAMWKERAVSLISSIMPALTWKRDHQDIPMSVSSIREYLSLPKVIKLSREETVPAEIRAGLIGYLDTLPGYIADAYDDDGNPKPPGPDTPAYDTTTASQQHGYLSMQFTRALQSLGDEYGYIFDTQAADVDMVDVVLNRRILVVLIPALEKSSDETANLGKIVAATIKGMMGSTLGATVEGESSTVIENKPTQSATPFMTVFDEVGYYTAQGMAVMAAQARSLGFCLVYSAQDLPALEKRVKEEARSITANCNIKIFGKLEDPTQTKEFFEKTVGSAMVMEASGFQLAGSSGSGSYHDTKQASLQIRARASYEGLRGFNEGQAIITFGEMVMECNVFYSNPGFAKAMRVTRFIALPPPDENLIRNADTITKVRDLMVHKSWTAKKADVAVETPPEIDALRKGYKVAEKAGFTGTESAMSGIASVYALNNPIEKVGQSDRQGDSKAPAAPPLSAKPATPPASAPSADDKPAAPIVPNLAAVKEKTPGRVTIPASSKPVSDETPPPGKAESTDIPDQPDDKSKVQNTADRQTGDSSDTGENANPMAFFKKPDAGTPDQEKSDTTNNTETPSGAVPAASAQETQKPEQDKPAATQQPEQPPQTPAQQTPPLDTDAIDALRRAGKEAEDKIIKSGKDDDSQKS